MAIIIRRSGTREGGGETISEFKSRMQRRRIARQRQEQAMIIKRTGGSVKFGRIVNGKREIISSFVQDGKIVMRTSLIPIDLSKEIKREPKLIGLREIKRDSIVIGIPTKDALREAERKIDRAKEGEFESVEDFMKQTQITLTAPQKQSLRQRLAQKKRELELIAFREKGTLKGQIAGLGGLGLVGAGRGALGLIEFVTHPIKTAKETALVVKTLAKTPRKSAQLIFTEFQKDPVGIVAEFAVFGKGIQTIGRLAKATPLVEIVRAESFIIRQPKNVRVVVRNILKADRIQRKIKPIDPKKIKSVSFKDVEKLTNMEATALKTALQDTNSVVFGSKSASVLSGKKTKIPKDLDVAVANIDKFNKAVFKNLPESQRKNFGVGKEKIFNIERGKTINTNTFSRLSKKAKRNFIRINNKIYDLRTIRKIADVKPLKRLVQQRSLITKKGRLPVAGFKRKLRLVDEQGSILPSFKKELQQALFDVPTQKQVKIEGIKFTSFGEQTTRKGLGTLQTILEKNIKRAKDPEAFVQALKVQLNALKRQKPKTPLGKFNRDRKVVALSDSIKVLEKDLLKIKPKPKERVKKPKEVMKVKGRAKPKRRATTLEKPSKKPSVQPSQISKFPSSVLVLKPSSVVPSKVPSRKPSRVPSKKPSVVPSKIPSVVPSKITSFPSSITSSVPPSKVPSRVPSRISVIPKKAIPKKPLKISKIKRKKLPSKKKIKKIKLKPTKQKLAFTTTIVRAKGKKGVRFRKFKGKEELILFTGTELR